MTFLIAYAGALLTFGALDALWLTTMGAALYRATLGDLLATDIRLAPAIGFYLVYPVGIVAFAALPALRAESIGIAIGYGALFGAIAYATYDLTNYATLRTWSLQITLVDIVYGAVASAIAAAAGYLLVRGVSPWL